jgi:hypothetical protein
MLYYSKKKIDLVSFNKVFRFLKKEWSYIEKDRTQVFNKISKFYKDSL